MTAGGPETARPRAGGPLGALLALVDAPEPDLAAIGEEARRLAAIARDHFGPAPLHAAFARLVRAATLVEGPGIFDREALQRAAADLCHTAERGVIVADAPHCRAVVPETAPETSARITIDAAAVARNWRSLADRSRGECAAVVKADAYGLGIARIAPPLVREGCTTFCVALEEEGMALRHILDQHRANATIYVLNGLFNAFRAAGRSGLIPFVSSPAALAEWPDDLPFALNVDTGMNRLGFTPAEALAVRRRPVLVASHFAAADMPDHPLNRTQEVAFRPVREAFAAVPASFANSAALLTRPEAHFELVRPGIALYGGSPAEGVPPLEPVVKLEARVIQVRTVEPGGTVGYGAAETVRRPSRVAIASVGYADGYLRAAGGSDRAAGAPAFVNGVRTRLLGRVSMDLLAVDVTDAHCGRGDFVELFGPNIPLDEAAAHAGTIGYELLTGLSRRAERRAGPL
jgi:alanine racemase